MTDGVLLRETLKDSDLDKYRYGNLFIFLNIFFYVQSAIKTKLFIVNGVTAAELS